MSSSTNTDRQQCIDTLFTRFAAIYGHIWKSQFKDLKFTTFAKKEWMDALQRFSDNIIERATDECRECYDMPPTLPQMVRCCKSIVSRQFIQVVEKPFKPANRETVLATIKQWKAHLHQ